MIVVDLEASGIDWNKCGIVEIGAIDIETKETFFQESRINKEDIILNNSKSKKTVLEVLGKSEEELRDEGKQTEKQLLKNFINWAGEKEIFICQNPQFDIGYLWTKTRKYGLELPFKSKVFDLHTLAQSKCLEKNKEFFIENKKSKLNIKRISEFCGLKDNRKIHNALTDAKLEAECFNRLAFGKNLLEEYSESPVPKHLIKNNNPKN